MNEWNTSVWMVTGPSLLDFQLMKTESSWEILIGLKLFINGWIEKVRVGPMPPGNISCDGTQREISPVEYPLEIDVNPE